MVAYAAALCAFGSYAYPRVKRYWVTSKSDDQMKEEEEEKDQRREEKKHAQMMHAISKSITEDLAQFEKKVVIAPRDDGKRRVGIRRQRGGKIERGVEESEDDARGRRGGGERERERS